MINPLLRPQEVEKELQGDALVNQIQIRMMQQDIKSPAFNAYAKDVMETKGYPTKTIQEYRIEFPSTIGALLPSNTTISGLGGQLNATPPSVPVSEQTPMSGLPKAPKAIRSPGLPTTPTQIGIQDIETSARAPDAGLFNRVGQQLIGYDDQFSGINDRLNKIEEGIASLIQNRGQGLNMNTGGLGYFFNPFGGFYG